MGGVGGVLGGAGEVLSADDSEGGGGAAAVHLTYQPEGEFSFVGAPAPAGCYISQGLLSGRERSSPQPPLFGGPLTAKALFPGEQLPMTTALTVPRTWLAPQASW